MDDLNLDLDLSNLDNELKTIDLELADNTSNNHNRMMFLPKQAHRRHTSVRGYAGARGRHTGAREAHERTGMRKGAHGRQGVR